MTETGLNAEQIIREKYKALSKYLNEKSRRIWAATEAKSYGRGGISLVSRATGLRYKTIKRGFIELEGQESLEGERIRRVGGGRKRQATKDPTLLQALETLVEPVSRGDPESPLRWTCKSTYKLSEELQNQGHQICQRSVCSRLQELGYSLQAPRKTQEGTQEHPDRNAQFEYINEKVKAFQHQNQPVISVDTKKKEKLGNFKNPGKEYHQKGHPPEVNVYDFLDKRKGKAVPYGVYDMTHDKGWVNVGISHDTAEFAVESIRSWWQQMGKALYPEAMELLITADCGGSNGYRLRLWKVELQKLATELTLTIHVSHFPPGTSKWNKIEHRLFSFISKNWRGRTLIDRATVVNLISHTKTKTGLEVKARLDERGYQKGIKVSDKELAAVNLQRDEFHGEWNYKIRP